MNQSGAIGSCIRAGLAGVLACVALLGGVARAEDGGTAPTAAPAEGEILGHSDLGRIRPFLPREFWRLRRHFFYPGMRLEIGPAHRDYTPAPQYVEATARFSGSVKIGKDNSLVGYVAGQPFPMEEIRCKSDPQAGVKLAWNFDRQWEGAGSRARFRVTILKQGRVQDGGIEGRIDTVQLANRVEPDYLDNTGGTIFRGEPRKLVTRTELSAPPGAAGTWLHFTRYRSSENAPEWAALDDVWSYSPSEGAVRHMRPRHRATPVEGTEIVADDLASFGGIVTQFEWECLGFMDLLAPVNSAVRGYPYDRAHDFGPLGISYASDRWEIRPALKLRMIPKDPDYPYARKDLYLDRETLRALYSFAYDRTGALWKAIWHNGRFSEDDPDYYPGWEGIPAPRDAKTVSDIVLNVQTGVGTRIEYWDNYGTPLGGKPEIKHFIDRQMREQGI